MSTELDARPQPLPPRATHHAMAQPSSPVRTQQFSIDLGGAPAQVVVLGYTDRVMVIVSQAGTLGTVVAAQKEAVLGGGSTYRVDTVLGSRTDPAAELCGRQLAEGLEGAGCELPLLLCLGTAPGAGGGAGRAAVRAVVDGVLAHRVW